MKSDEFFRCLGWLKPWFGVGGVVKITFSVEHGFSRLWAPFWWSFSPENCIKVDMWLTLGVQGAPMGGVGSRSRFCRFPMIFRGPPGVEAPCPGDGNGVLPGALISNSNRTGRQ